MIGGDLDGGGGLFIHNFATAHVPNIKIVCFVLLLSGITIARAL
jgi:hypothetical protein